MGKSRYFYIKPGRIYGPVSSETLIRLANEGQLQPEYLIAHNGTSKWRIAAEVRGLRFPACHDGEAASSAVLGYAQQPLASLSEVRIDAPEPEVIGDPWTSERIEIRRPKPSTNSGLGTMFFLLSVFMGAVTAYGISYTPPFIAVQAMLKEWIYGPPPAGNQPRPEAERIAETFRR